MQTNRTRPGSGTARPTMPCRVCVVRPKSRRWQRLRHRGGVERLGQFDHDVGALARGGVERDRSADEACPLAHAFQAVVPFADRFGIEADAVVGNVDPHDAVLFGDPHFAVRRPAMPFDVRERFLDDAKDRRFENRGQSLGLHVVRERECPCRGR